MSRADSPSFSDRIATLFTINLLYTLMVFLFILAFIGTLLWLAERKVSPDQFPSEPIRGIANGIWCAIVSMSTTGYGDIAPRTFMGRIVADDSFHIICYNNGCRNCKFTIIVCFSKKQDSFCRGVRK